LVLFSSGEFDRLLAFTHSGPRRCINWGNYTLMCSLYNCEFALI
jgi:hypothetical protein